MLKSTSPRTRQLHQPSWVEDVAVAVFAAGTLSLGLNLWPKIAPLWPIWRVTAIEIGLAIPSVWLAVRAVKTAVRRRN